MILSWWRESQKPVLFVPNQNPCGYFSDPSKECTCTSAQIQKYMAKISGPLLDCIDLHIEVSAMKYKELASKSSAEASTQIGQRLMKAGEVQGSGEGRDSSAMRTCSQRT
jgi:magnesium chelatase family protein